MVFATTAGPSSKGGFAPYRGDGQKKKGFVDFFWGVGVPHHSRKAKGGGNFMVL